MLEHDAYSGHTIWVSELVESLGARLPLSTVPATLLTLGLVPYLLTAAFFLFLPEQQDPYLVAIQMLAATIPVIGPVLIWRYDQHVFPTFVREVDDVVRHHDALIQTVDRYELFFSERYWILMLPWAGLIVAAMVANLEFFQGLGATGLFHPAFLTYLVFATWWSIITGIGLHGALTTVLCIRAVGDLELVIDPLHHDGLGGLSTIGYFSIRATLMNSIGSFALPIAFAIAAGGEYQSLVYLAVAGYIGFILLSFAYPTLYVNRRAQKIRQETLQQKREQIRALEERMSFTDATGDLEQLEQQLKIRTLRDDFNEYQSVKLYPLSVSILTRLASSILLPIGFTLLETYVFSG